MDGRSGDQMGLRQLPQALTILAVAEDGGSIEDQSFPPDMPSFELGPPHTGAHSLDDQTTLQLRDGSDDDNNRAAQGPAGIDLFAEADELDVQPVKLIQQLEEMSH